MKSTLIGGQNILLPLEIIRNVAHTSRTDITQFRWSLFHIIYDVVSRRHCCFFFSTYRVLFSSMFLHSSFVFSAFLVSIESPTNKEKHWDGWVNKETFHKKKGYNERCHLRSRYHQKVYFQIIYSYLIKCITSDEERGEGVSDVANVFIIWWDKQMKRELELNRIVL